MLSYWRFESFISLQRLNILLVEPVLILGCQGKPFFKRKCSPSPLCPLCKVEVETLEHVLFYCDWASAVWICSSIFDEINLTDIRKVDLWCLDLLGSDSRLEDQSKALGLMMYTGLFGRHGAISSSTTLLLFLLRHIKWSMFRIGKDKKTCLGVIFRDSSGSILDGFCCSVEAFLPFMTEALVLRRGVANGLEFSSFG
ncbi:TMV resistance protein N-like [Senna tora]|uniref:TMV resistance protein N-like n=1 Tax=Senna tora TaxID=362788 RepID=A0A835CGY5_9FABA|nr:TMV resistance protein N-like [Senna tora]